MCIYVYIYIFFIYLFIVIILVIVIITTILIQIIVMILCSRSSRGAMENATPYDFSGSSCSREARALRV